MPRAKKPTYSIDSTKELSNRARYEYWRERGIVIDPDDGPPHSILDKKELDEYTDARIWELKHPGKVAKRDVKLGKARGVQAK